MTKYEEDEIYCDKIFEKLSTMNESEMVSYLSRLDESAVIFSLKRQASRIERALKKQEKALDHIVKLAKKRDPQGQNESINKILEQINVEKGLIKTFTEIGTDAAKPKTLARMQEIATAVDQQSSLLGKNKSGEEGDAGIGSKDLINVGKDEVKKVQDVNAADALLNSLK